MSIEIVFNASRKIKDGRTLSDVLGTVIEEVGELSTEIGIKNGHKNRPPGKDGIIGEAIDAIAALKDIIFLEDPNFTQEEFDRRLSKKCDKWVEGKTNTGNLITCMEDIKLTE